MLCVPGEMRGGSGHTFSSQRASDSERRVICSTLLCGGFLITTTSLKRSCALFQPPRFQCGLLWHSWIGFGAVLGSVGARLAQVTALALGCSCQPRATPVPRSLPCPHSSPAPWGAPSPSPVLPPSSTPALQEALNNSVIPGNAFYSFSQEPQPRVFI